MRHRPFLAHLQAFANEKAWRICDRTIDVIRQNRDSRWDKKPIKSERIMIRLSENVRERGSEWAMHIAKAASLLSLKLYGVSCVLVWKLGVSWPSWVLKMQYMRCIARDWGYHSRNFDLIVWFNLITCKSYSISKSRHLWKVFSTHIPVHYTKMVIFHGDPQPPMNLPQLPQNLGVVTSNPQDWYLWALVYIRWVSRDRVTVNLTNLDTLSHIHYTIIIFY